MKLYTQYITIFLLGLLALSLVAHGTIHSSDNSVYLDLYSHLSPQLRRATNSRSWTRGGAMGNMIQKRLKRKLTTTGSASRCAAPTGTRPLPRSIPAPLLPTRSHLAPPPRPTGLPRPAQGAVRVPMASGETGTGAARARSPTRSSIPTARAATRSPRRPASSTPMDKASCPIGSANTSRRASRALRTGSVRRSATGRD